MIAMEAHNAIRALASLQKLIGVTANFKQNIECWSLMVLPKVVIDLFLEYFVVIFAIAHVYYEVVGQMPLLQILGHIIDGVAVGLLEA